MIASTDPLTEKLETVSIKLTKSNITVKLVVLPWVPQWQDAGGRRRVDLCLGITSSLMKGESRRRPRCVPSVLSVFLHDLVGPGEEDSGADEGQMDEDLPLNLLVIFIGDVHEGFQQMDA